MTNSVLCFSHKRERKKKKSQNFFSIEKGQKNVKNFIFRRTRFAHVAFALKKKKR